MILSYEAVDGQGRRARDKMEASDVREALEQLRRRGLFVTRIVKTAEERRPDGGAWPREGGRVGRRVHLSLKVLAPFTRQMAMLLKSGSGLVPAIAAIRRQTKNPKEAALLGRLIGDLEEGSTLTEALRKHPDTFDAVYCAIVSAGEATGTLAEMFERLATIVTKRRAMRNKVVGAIAYPVLLIAMCSNILVALALFVLPRFETMFDDLGVKVPTITKVLLALGESATSYWPVWGGALAAAVIGCIALPATDRGRQWLSDVQLAIPFFGHLRSRLIQGQILRTMGMLLESGVGVLETLDLARQSTRNRRFQRMFDEVEEVVTAGGHPSSAFESSGLVEPYICQAIHTGEESGNLGGAMTYCADMLDDANEELIKAAMRLLEPLILILMGVVVGGVAISLFLPLFDMTSALR